MALGIFFILVSSTHWYLKYQALSLDAKLISEYVDQTHSEDNIPKHIAIKWFVDTDIEKHLFQEGNWTISETVASYLSNSAKPGENGNIIIYGHNKRSILGNIRALKGDEIITITTQDNNEHKYAIEKITEVDPKDTEYLKPTTEETLTLYTCAGFMDKKRFIVQAKPYLENSH